MRNKRLIIIFSILLTITILVLLGSIIFSVKSVVANCFNHASFGTQGEVAQLDEAVIQSVQLKGKSVFLLDDEEIISQIESAVPSVKVVNIERVFPSAVRINYVKMFSYFEAKINNTYYEFLCNGKITAKLDVQSDLKKIRVLADFSGEYDIGDTIGDSFLLEVATSFERLGLSYESSAVFFDFLDLTKEDDVVYVGIRNSNTVFKLYDKSNFFNHLRLAYNFYSSDLFDETTHTMIVVANNTGFYSSDRYVP